MKKQKAKVAIGLVIEKDSRLGTITLGAFTLLVFGMILMSALILRADGIIR